MIIETHCASEHCASLGTINEIIFLGCIEMIEQKFFKNGHIYMKVAECPETNGKSIFRFLIFKIWSVLYSKLIHFLRILIIKSTITQTLKIGKLIFHWFQNIAQR